MNKNMVWYKFNKDNEEHVKLLAKATEINGKEVVGDHYIARHFTSKAYEDGAIKEIGVPVIPSCETCRFKHDPTEANCWFVRIKEGKEPKLCWEYSLYEPLFGYVKAIKQEYIEETDTGISTKDTSKDLPMNNEQNKHIEDEHSNDIPIYTGSSTKKFKSFSIHCDINSEEDLDNLLDWIDLQS